MFHVCVVIFPSHGVCIEVFSNFICCGVECGFNTYADFSVFEFHSLLSFCSISMVVQCYGMRSKFFKSLCTLWLLFLNWSFSLFFVVCISSRKNLYLLFSLDLNWQFLGRPVYSIINLQYSILPPDNAVSICYLQSEQNTVRLFCLNVGVNCFALHFPALCCASRMEMFCKTLAHAVHGLNLFRILWLTRCVTMIFCFSEMALQSKAGLCLLNGLVPFGCFFEFFTFLNFASINIYLYTVTPSDFLSSC